MSATFDQLSFANFLQPIDPSGYINTFTIPDFEISNEGTFKHVREVYLDNIANMLESSPFIQEYRSILIVLRLSSQRLKGHYLL